LWDDICCQRYGITDEKFRRFRYGVQVNSLGLTEQQPENNVYRILLEMLAVVLSRNARARAVQLPAWNEALGLPRAWDQQWSLRLQQIVAYETDLLEYADIFEGSTEIAAKVASLKQEARTELEIILDMGGAIAAIEDGYMKRALVHSNTQRLKAIERGEIKIIGVNMFTAGATSPLSTGEGEMVLTVSESVEFEQIEKLQAWRAKRDTDAVKDALAGLKAAAGAGSNIMEPSITCAKAGVTTGEWAEVLRGVFGEYRAPTGVLLIMDEAAESTLEDVRARVRHLTQALGKTPRFLMAKPGLDGHSNGAEQIAVRAANCGLEVIYEGIRLTPEQIVNTAIDKKVDLIGLSILSGSHVPLIRDVMNRLRAAGLASIPVVAGGIIPPEDINILKQLGVARIYTPKDFDLNTIIGNLVDLMERSPANADMVRAG
jgi:(2R)-ethylmalonyl-CoA mutase